MAIDRDKLTTRLGDDGKSPTALQTGCSMVFLAIFLVVGLVFAGVIGWTLFKQASTYGWEPVTAEVLSSEVRSSDEQYYIDVRYRYDAGGRSHVSGRYTVNDEAFDDYAAALRRADAFVPGQRVTAYVRDSAPGEAVLKRGGSWWIALVLPLPLVFVAVGGGGMIVTWRKRSRDRDGDGAPDARPIGKGAAASRRGAQVGLVIGAALAVSGVIGVYFLFVKTTLRVMDADGWVATPAVVVASGLRETEGEDGSTWKANVLYEYEFDGRTYRSNHYKFNMMSSSDSSGAQRIRNDHPVGKAVTAYVNPEDPYEAVLVRGMTPGVWLTLLILLLTVAGVIIMASSRHYLRKLEMGRPLGGAGAGGGIWGRRASAGSGAAAATADPSAPGRFAGLPDFDRAQVGPVQLKPVTSRWTKAIGTLVFALLWNGIVGAIGWTTASNGDFGGLFFLGIFALVGVATLGAAVYFFLAAQNPRPIFTVDRLAVPAGESFDVSWRFDGPTHHFTSVRVWMEGREKATYRRGTRTYTDKHTFAEVELGPAEAKPSAAEGRVEVMLPPETMHSFQADNNAVEWLLRVKGEIPRWPDVDDEFMVFVLPAGRHD